MAEVCGGETGSDRGGVWMGVAGAFSLGEEDEALLGPPWAGSGLDRAPVGGLGVVDSEFGAAVIVLAGAPAMVPVGVSVDAPMVAAVFRGDALEGMAALGVAGCSDCRSCSRRR